MRSTIICVDDDKWMLTVLSDQLNEWLGKNYMIEKALTGPEGLEIIDTCIREGTEISLVISDYIMPGMKGDEFLEQVKLKTPMTRRIMLTGFAAIEGVTNAINKAGIYRFLSKPWDNKDMMLTVLQAIRSYEQDRRAEKLANDHKELYHKVQGIAVSLQTRLKQAISALSAAVEVRDGSLPGHAERVADYSVRIARELGISEDEIKILETSALLHDVGALGLGDVELDALRVDQCYTRNDVTLRQAEHAKLILSHMDENILPGVIYHMERVDGSGPHNMSAAAIPLSARIIGLCNYFDLSCASDPGKSPLDVLGSIKASRGKIFDDLLFDTLIKIIARI